MDIALDSFWLVVDELTVVEPYRSGQASASAGACSIFSLPRIACTKRQAGRHHLGQEKNHYHRRKRRGCVGRYCAAYRLGRYAQKAQTRQAKPRAASGPAARLGAGSDRPALCAADPAGNAANGPTGHYAARDPTASGSRTRFPR